MTVIPLPPPVVEFVRPGRCGYCGKMRGAFVNEYGTVHCSGCEAWRPPVVTVDVAEVARWLPRTPQSAEDMCAALEASIAMVKKQQATIDAELSEVE